MQLNEKIRKKYIKTMCQEGLNTGWCACKFASTQVGVSVNGVPVNGVPVNMRQN